MNRAASSRYLFSGILKCAECGSNLTLVAARGKGRSVGYYGCPGHLHRGICSNNVYQRRDLVEEKLLTGLRTKLMDAAAVDYAVREVPKGLVAAEGDEQAKTLEKSRSRLQSEIERLTEAIARSGGSEALPGALRKKRQSSTSSDRQLGPWLQSTSRWT